MTTQRSAAQKEVLLQVLQGGCLCPLLSALSIDYLITSFRYVPTSIVLKDLPKLVTVLTTALTVG